MLQVLNSENEYKNFLQSNEIAGVYYSSHKCGVCNTMKPQVLAVFEKYGIALGEIVVNDNRELAAQQLILASPTVVFYENSRELFRESGFVDLQKLNRNLNLITN